MNKDNTEYKEGSHDDFINYLFSNEPKNIGEVKLELPLNDSNKNISLHEFEQLLMIYVDGLKYFYSQNNQVNINNLSQENIEHVNQYFLSMNYNVDLEIFPTINDYKFKFPDYFKYQNHINSNTKLEDFYYEIYGENNKVFRISFKSIN